MLAEILTAPDSAEIFTEAQQARILLMDDRAAWATLMQGFNDGYRRMARAIAEQSRAIEGLSRVVRYRHSAEGQPPVPFRQGMDTILRLVPAAYVMATAAVHGNPHLDLVTVMVTHLQQRAHLADIAFRARRRKRRGAKEPAKDKTAATRAAQSRDARKKSATKKMQKGPPKKPRAP